MAEKEPGDGVGERDGGVEGEEEREIEVVKEEGDQEVIRRIKVTGFVREMKRCNDEVYTNTIHSPLSTFK